MKHNSPRLTDGISRFLITVMGIVMMIAGIRLLIMGVDNFIQPIRHAGWVTTSANVTDISETVIKNNFFRNKRTRIHYKWTYVHVLLGKHADTGNVVRNQTAHAGDSAVLTSMYSAMRRS